MLPTYQLQRWMCRSACWGGGGGGGGVLCDIPRQKKAIEGPDLSAVNFDEVLDIFKEKNRLIRL